MENDKRTVRVPSLKGRFEARITRMAVARMSEKSARVRDKNIFDLEAALLLSCHDEWNMKAPPRHLRVFLFTAMTSTCYQLDAINAVVRKVNNDPNSKYNTNLLSK